MSDSIERFEALLEQHRHRQAQQEKGETPAAPPQLPGPFSYEALLKADPVQMSMLDQALEGATDQQKARVRGVLLRFGIDTDHEFYIIFVAIGQLLVLVEEAPENWRSLFDDVHKELKQWSKENFKSLESIQQHAQTSAELIAVLRQLLVSMKQSDNSSARTQSTLSSLSLKLESIESGLTSMKTSSSSLEQVSDQVENIGTTLLSIRTSNLVTSSHLENLSSQVETLTHRNGQSGIWGSSFRTALAVAAAAVLFVNGRATTQLVEAQAQQITRQSERIDWLLEKANRAECEQGIKPASDLQCLQFQ